MPTASGRLERSLVKLYYDVISPYSWFAFEALQRYATVWDMDVLLKPFFLGAVMTSTGNQPPMMVPAKKKYMERDLGQVAKYWGVPMNPLKDPFDAILTKGTLPAQRYLCAVQLRAPHFSVAATRALWVRRWSMDSDIHSATDLGEISTEIGLDSALAQEIIDSIHSAEVKTMLKAHTNEAIQSGMRNSLVQ